MVKLVEISTGILDIIGWDNIGLIIWKSIGNERG